MDHILNPEIKKPRRRLRRKRNPPPPLFNSETTVFNSLDAVPNLSLFPGNSGGPPTVPMNTNEMFDRFNQLLDWHLPVGNNPPKPDDFPNMIYSGRSRDHSLLPEDEFSNQNTAPKRRITDANDLRHHLDQQSKRLKETEGRKDHDRRERWKGSLDRSRIERFEIERTEPWGGIGNRTAERWPENDERIGGRYDDRWNETFDNVGGRNSNRWRETYDSVGGRYAEHWPDGGVGGRGDHWPEKYDNFEQQSRSDLRGELSRNRSIQENEVLSHSCEFGDRKFDWTPVNAWASSKRLDYTDKTTDRWDDDRNCINRESRNTESQDFGRQVKEYWPDRIPTDMDQPSRENSNRWAGYSDDRQFPSGSRTDVYEARRDLHFRQGDNKNDDFLSQQHGTDIQFGAKNVDPRMWERDPYPNRPYNDRYEDLRHGVPENRDDNPHLNALSSSASYYRPGSPMRKGERSRSPVGIDYGHRPPVRVDRSLSPRGNHPKELSQEDLTVLIHKTRFARYTFDEADRLRSTLIDLVMNCNNTDQMPEFVQSGLMRGGQGFYVTCRTLESMDWLLKQTLPPLNGVKLFIKKSNEAEPVKISAYASRCSRTRDEILKLLKLQNSKKGFNFDNWRLRSYQTSPSGIYVAFDVAEEEIPVLKKYGCQLSFELKTLIFKISNYPKT